MSTMDPSITITPDEAQALRAVNTAMQAAVDASETALLTAKLQLQQAAVAKRALVRTLADRYGFDAGDTYRLTGTVLTRVESAS